VQRVPEAKKPTKTRAPRASAQKSAEPAVAAYASKYTIGDQISHPMYGDGTVTAIDAKKLTIDFPAGVTRQIIDAFVKHR
jgi:hypothetical protein